VAHVDSLALAYEEDHKVGELGNEAHHKVGHHAEHRGLGNLQNTPHQGTERAEQARVPLAKEVL
jgi:hypothetical protein